MQASWNSSLASTCFTHEPKYLLTYYQYKSRKTTVQQFDDELYKEFTLQDLEAQAANKTSVAAIILNQQMKIKPAHGVHQLQDQSVTRIAPHKPKFTKAQPIASVPMLYQQQKSMHYEHNFPTPTSPQLSIHTMHQVPPEQGFYTRLHVVHQDFHGTAFKENQ